MRRLSHTSLPVRMFAPLMSLCTTPCSCRYASPCSTCTAFRSLAFSSPAEWRQASFHLQKRIDR